MTKRMEVPRLALHNLQVKPSAVTPEAPKYAKPEPSHVEPSPPPSRVLRNGKRVPTGTATKTVPRTQSQANRVPAHDSPGKSQAAVHSAENAEGVKASHSKVSHQRTTDSPLSQLPLNKQIFSSPQLPDFSEPMQRSTPPTQVASAAADSQLSKPGPILFSTPPLSRPASASKDSPTVSTFAVDNHAFSSTTSPQNPAASASRGLIPSPTAFSAHSPPTHSSGSVPAGESLQEAGFTSPPAFTAMSRLTDAPTTPTLFPAASQTTPLAPHPTPVAPHPTPVPMPGSSSTAVQPILSQHTSPDEVVSSLQNLNLQSRPFDFADDAPDNNPAQAGRGDTDIVHLQHGGHLVSNAGSVGMHTTPDVGDASQLTDTTTATQEGHDSQLAGQELARSTSTTSAEYAEQEAAETELDGQQQDAVPINYVSRRTTDPYMEKKLRGLQKEEWSEADGTFKRHKSKLEVAKEQAAAARASELSGSENAAVRRLVQGAFQKVVATGGQSLGESMVRHKSKLQLEKEQAVQQRKIEEAAQAQRAKRKVVHTPSSLSKQGLGALGKHKSRLEKEKEAAAAARKSRSGSSSPAVPKKVPSYMRPTSASKAMQVPKGLGEDVAKPMSRLEREKEAAASLRASSDSHPVRRSTNVRSKVAEAWQGQSLGAVMHKRKSKLELDKENAAAAANKTSALPKQASAGSRKSFGFGGQGLGEMKVHKSKLQREQDAWAKAAAAEEAKANPNLRKSVSSSISQRPSGQPAKKVPSYMKSTHTSQTRMSLDGASDTDARFAH